MVVRGSGPYKAVSGQARAHKLEFAMADMSFLPEDYLERRNQRRTNIVSLTLFVVVMTGVIGAFFVTVRERTKIYTLQKQINNEYGEAAKRLKQLDELQVKKQEMVRKARITTQLVERIPRSLILAELVNNMPGTLSLLKLEMKTEEVKQARSRAATALERARKQKDKKEGGVGGGEEADAGPAAKATEVKFDVTGVAPTDVQVAQYMTSLGQSALFKDVNLVFSEEMKVNDRIMRKFNVQMRLNQEISTAELEPKLIKRAIKQNPMANTIQIDSKGNMVLPPEPAEMNRVYEAPGGKRP